MTEQRGQRPQLSLDNRNCAFFTADPQTTFLPNSMPAGLLQPAPDPQTPSTFLNNLRPQPLLSRQLTQLSKEKEFSLFSLHPHLVFLWLLLFCVYVEGREETLSAQEQETLSSQEQGSRRGTLPVFLKMRQNESQEDGFWNFPRSLPGDPPHHPPS